MAVSKITIPDFQFSGFYYPQILQRIRVFNRVNVDCTRGNTPGHSNLPYLLLRAYAANARNVLMRGRVRRPVDRHFSGFPQASGR